jgi:hypothetical protein
MRKGGVFYAHILRGLILSAFYLITYFVLKKTICELRVETLKSRRDGRYCSRRFQSTVVNYALSKEFRRNGTFKPFICTVPTELNKTRLSFIGGLKSAATK